MKSLIIILASICLFNRSHKPNAAADEVKIISKTGICSGDLKGKAIKNISSAQYTSAIITKQIWVNGRLQDTIAVSFDKLAPNQEKEIACAGCEFIDLKNICVYLSITSAEYVSP